MITQMPQRLREALGNEASRDLEGWLEGLLVADYVQHTEWVETRDALGRVEAELADVVRHNAASDLRQSAFERDMAEFKAEFQAFRREVTERFDRLIAEMNLRFDRQVAEMNERFNRQAAEMNERFDRQAAEMNLRFDRQAAEMNLRFDRQAADQITFANAINERLDRQYQQMLVQTRWNVGLIGLFGTIFAVLYGIGQLKP